MKAVVYHEYGLPQHLRYTDVAPPIPQPDEVLIKVKASSINSWDWDRLTGKPHIYRMLSGWGKPRLPILGADVAGVVEAVGNEVTAFAKGDEVLGDLSGGNWGCFAEYVCAKTTCLTQKPPQLSFEEAATLPQAGILALQGLNKYPIQSGMKVLINGAGGGVGTFAIQMAKSLGAEITGVDAAHKLDFIQSLGAHHVLDYQVANFTRSGIQYDYVLDMMALHSALSYSRALQPNGAYVMVGGHIPSILQTVLLGGLAGMPGKKHLGLLIHKPNTTDLKTLITQWQDGIIVPVIDKVYPLSEMADAFEHYASGQTIGKIVMSV